MENAKVRLAVEEDLTQIVQISRYTFTETFVGDFSRPYTKDDLRKYYSKHHSLKTYLDYFNDRNHALYVLLVQGEIEGYSLVGPCHLPHKDVTKSCGELKKIYIKKEKQGFGYGKGLLEQSFQYLEMNFQQQWIGVWSGNLRAQKIYRSYGFEKVGEYIYPVGEVLDEEFILKKKSAKPKD